MLTLVALHLSALLSAVGPACAAAPPEVWVSPKGDDANPGVAGKPVATLGRALALTRELRTPDAKTARIVLRGGVYRSRRH